MNPPRTAYVDESIHDRSRLYAIATVVADPVLRDEVRDRLMRVVPTANPPHWNAEDSSTREMLLEQVAKLPLCARVYACRFDGPKRKERARGRALAWMVAELEYGVRHVVLDRREEHRDACDRRLMIGLAGRPPRFAAMHRSSAEEPLLWVADIVVSAVAGDLAYGGDKQIERIKDVLEAVNCEP